MSLYLLVYHVCLPDPVLLATAVLPASVVAQAPRSEMNYYIYVGAESADMIHIVEFGPDGTSVVETSVVGELPLETEGPHALIMSPDGEYLYMTTGHGIPDGKLWKFRAGTDELVAEPILLGKFPATLDVSPDGLYAFVVNFNLHGDPVPSSVSVAFTPDMIEVEQVPTCTKPHGLRVGPSGTHLYTNCLMDDQMVEIDTRTFEVTRRFSVAVGEEGAIATDWVADPLTHGPRRGPTNSCGPTWAEPSIDGSKVFVACNAGDRLLQIDVETWSLDRVLETGRGIYNLDAAADGTCAGGVAQAGGRRRIFRCAELEEPGTGGVVHEGDPRRGDFAGLPIRLHLGRGCGSRARQGRYLRLAHHGTGRRGRSRSAGRRNRVLEDGAGSWTIGSADGVHARLADVS